MKTLKFFTILSIACFIFACSEKTPSFTIEGTISDADSTVIYLEKRELNQTTIIDSVKLDNKGQFKFKNTSTTYPEFYVLRLEGQAINIAIDSTESLKINAGKQKFATDYTTEGSLVNQQIKSVVLAQYKAGAEIKTLQKDILDKNINEEEYLKSIRVIADNYKETARNIIMSDIKSPAAYFALFQKVNGYLFFDPYDKDDYKMFAAVATAWDNYYKDSPRTSHLREYTLIAMKTRKQNETDLSESMKEIESSEYYNIALPNVNGKAIELSSLKGKVVLLDFTVYQAEESPLHNIALNKVYSKFKPNLEIYQVSLDSDKHFWKNAAINLPWIAVHDETSINSNLIFKYNIQNLPSIFLINRNGNIVKRLLPSDNIESEIQKIL